MLIQKVQNLWLKSEKSLFWGRQFDGRFENLEHQWSPLSKVCSCLSWNCTL